MSKHTIFSFFAGSGFLDLGFEKVGFNVDFVNEYQASFMEAYKYARKKMELPEPLYGEYRGDINDLLLPEHKESFLSKVKAAQQDSLVGFIGGPPCPDFSVAGKNKGEHGDNGSLTKSYVEVIMTFKPDFFVFENVRGLWRTKKHREFYDRMKSILDAEYDLVDRLTNCIEYGAPQDRDRIFLFGIKKSFKSDLSKFCWEDELKYPRNTIFKEIPWPSTNGEPSNFSTFNDWQEKLTVDYWFKLNDVENHPNGKHHFIPRSGLAKFQVIKEGDVSKKSYKRLHRHRYSPTAAYGNNEVHIHPLLPRRISAAEAMAIQSLPKEFELPPSMTLTDMFKTIGNGVPFLAAKGLAQTIQNFLNQLESNTVRQ